MRPLTIVVPYRDRETHLKSFVPHLRAYFARDKVDKYIPYRVLVIEQETGLPFNRGTLANIGFQLGRADSDYTCFHDVDYLPIWADYSWADQPAALVWYGTENRPIAPGKSNLRVSEAENNYVGGAILVPNEQFEKINGYANAYWGWGYEDLDIEHRFATIGQKFVRRKGTFSPLYHDHRGFDPQGRRTGASIANEAILLSRWPASGFDNHMRVDGLTSLSYEILDRRPISEGSKVERAASWEIVKVRLKDSPKVP